MKHKPIAVHRLVEEEIEEVVYNFLRDAAVNQPRIGIITDLKIE